MLFFKRLTAKALIYNQTDKTFLVVRHTPCKQENGYGFVGGGIKKAEQSSDALVRELREETHIILNTKDRIVQLDGLYISKQSFLFFCLENTTSLFIIYIEKYPDIKLNWELNAYKWISHIELFDILESHYRDVLNHFIKYNGKTFKEIF